MRRWLKRLGILIVVVAVVATGLGIFTVRRSFPQVDGTARLPGLDAEVRVVRDAEGVPHIYASSGHDLFAAQGYVHAQERFFQMDFWRHIGAARLSELLGPATVDTDRFLRTLRFVPTAEAEFADLSPEAQGILEAYADGVNAYLAERSGSALSLEYALIGLTNRDYEPEPWKPTDTLTWAKMMSWDLGSNLDQELARALTAGVVGVERTEQLWPPYPDDQPVIVPGDGVPAAAFSSPQLRAGMADLAATIQTVRDLTGAAGAEIGSNNWVVDGSKTATGAPILANDPHLSTQMPSIWFQVGLHCVDGGCPFDVVGFSFAGTPGVIIGHNARIAWGVTNLAPDTQDLVIERINPDNPHQYEADGEWVDMEVYTEEIAVAGGDDEALEIRWTRNGPIISDTFGSLEGFDETAGGVEVPDDYAVVLKWTSLQPTSLVEAILDLNTASDWDEFRAALSQWETAAQNVVYADVDGNIGYQATGKIPIRARGDGRWPVAGWDGGADWVDTVPYEDLPFVFNPASGYIVTANNAVVDGSYPYLLTTDWAYGYRAERITEVLDGAEGIDPAFMNRLQNDSFNGHAPELVPWLLAVNGGDEVQAMQDAIRVWSDLGDGPEAETFQNLTGSKGAAAYNATWRHLLLLLRDEIDPELVPLSGRDRLFVAVNALVEAPDDPWWDLVATENVETRDDILSAAMEAAYAELVERFGTDPADWRWGGIHTVEFRHGSLGESGIAPIEALFNRGPFEVPGGTSIVNAMSWSPADGYGVIAIPSMRMVVDMADFDRSTAIHSTGQSGHAYHPRYIDLAQPWADGETLPMRWSEEAVADGAQGALILTP